MERTDNAVELWAEEFSKKPIRPLTMIIFNKSYDKE